MAWRNVALLWLGLAALPSAEATIITADLVSLGSTSYRYEYNITNDGSLGGGTALKVIDFAFDPALYDEGSLSIASLPALNTDWFESIFGAVPGSPAFYEIEALSSGLADGDSVNGFAVEFFWLGSGLPGSQSFQILDGTSFTLLEEGQTTVNLPASAASAPGTLLLMVIGLPAILSVLRRNT